MNLFPAVQGHKGQGITDAPVPASNKSVAALAPIRQRMQELRQENPLALARRRLVEAADLGAPTHQSRNGKGAWGWLYQQGRQRLIASTGLHHPSLRTQRHPVLVRGPLNTGPALITAASTTTS